MNDAERPILIIIGNYKNGGIARRAAILANGFAKSGRMVSIVSTREKSDNSFFELSDGVEVVSVHDFDKSNCFFSGQKIKSFLNIKKIQLKIKLTKNFYRFLPFKAVGKKYAGYCVSHLKKSLKLRKCFLSYKNPVIIALGLDYAIDSYFASYDLKCSRIYGTRTYAEGEMGNHDTTIVKSILEKMSCIISQTQYTSDYFSNLGLSRNAVIYNPLQITTPVYSGMRSYDIVNFCRISREKKLDILLKAFSVFHSEYSDYEVKIYGNIVFDDEVVYKQELLNMAEEYGISECFHILEARQDIHEAVKDSAMFISTSEFEGLSNSMLEAMALGLPCICTDCDGGGAREMIIDGDNGLLIKKNNVGQLVEAMEQFAEDRVFACECGKRASEIRNRLDINNITAQWLNAVEKYC